MSLTISLFLALSAVNQAPHLESQGLSGYISANVQPPPAAYGYGVSLYSAAWPLVSRPISGFQIGLASTWILPDNRSVTTPLVPHGTLARDSMPERGPSFWTVFQTIEGGLGYWASNKFLAPTAKFRMNGTPDGYNHELSTPGWEFGGKPLPGDQMGIAQLSSHILVPPDGVTFASNTCGELLGYAWMALPLVPAKTVPVATGNQSWTLFFNAKNFRGPVAFYLPAAWSRMSERYEPAVGRGLDALPGLADSGAMEVNTVPQIVSETQGDTSYAKIPELQFPADQRGQTILMHDVTAYSKGALWDAVADWMNGGPAPDGSFKPEGSFMPTLTANTLQLKQGGVSWANGIAKWVSTATLDPHTFGLQWTQAALTPWKGRVRKARFPQYYRHQGASVDALEDTALPPSSDLKTAEFPAADQTHSYLPSENGGGVWKQPGPKAGPYRARLVDGSVVTYYWYRFIDQPSLQHAGLSEEDKRKLQAIVENIHRQWTPNKNYLAPPARGDLASLDPALIVKPPRGLEFGYVPIATRQDPGPPSK